MGASRSRNRLSVHAVHPGDVAEHGADFPDPFGTTRLAGAPDDPEVRRGIGEDIGDSVAADRLIDEPGAYDAFVAEDAPSGLEPEARSTE